MHFTTFQRLPKRSLGFADKFSCIQFVSIPKLKSATADLLATSAARLVPSNNRCSIEFIFRPSVPDMITNLQVFDNDQQILEFFY